MVFFLYGNCEYDFSEDQDLDRLYDYAEGEIDRAYDEENFKRVGIERKNSKLLSVGYDIDATFVLTTANHDNKIWRFEIGDSLADTNQDLLDYLKSEVYIISKRFSQHNKQFALENFDRMTKGSLLRI